MHTAAWVFLGAFALTSVLQLIFCFIENETLRKITKPFCVLLLAIFACIAVPTKPLIYIGAFLGCLGDAFLIRNKQKPFFIIGSILFISGHICFLIELTFALSYTVEWYWYLIVVGFLFILMLALYPITRKDFGKIALIGNVYIPTLLIGALLGVLLARDVPAIWPGILFTAGYIFYLISDTSLIVATFKKDYKRRDFYIMLTYLIGEFLIVFALVGAYTIA